MAVCGCLLYQLVHDFLIFSPSAESSNCELVMLVLYLPTKTYFNNVEGIVGACFPSTFQGPCPSLCRLGISPSYTTEAFFGFEIVGQHFSRNVMKSAPFQWCVWACSLILVSHLSDSNKHREHCVFASPAVHVQIFFPPYKDNLKTTFFHRYAVGMVFVEPLWTWLTLSWKCEPFRRLMSLRFAKPPRKGDKG